MRGRHILLANLFFAPFSYGGATVVAEQVARELAGLGYHITALSLCARDDLAPYTVVKSECGGIVNYLINLPKHRSYAQMYDNPEVTARVAELIHVLGPDLVHVHCIQEIGTGVITAAEGAKVPVILSVHDFWWLCERQFMIRLDAHYCGQDPIRIEKCKGCVDHFWSAKLRFEHLQKMSEKAALVTYPSRFAKELSERSGFAPGRGAVWENGVRLPGKGFAAKRAARRMQDRRIAFGYLGGPAQIKGWPTIKEAFSTLRDKDFKCVVVDGGRDAAWWKESDFRELPGEWEIYPRFSQDKMDDFYAQIDVLLFMSQWKETFGLAIREAIARGIPVIQTDSGGTVEHGGAVVEKLIPIGAPAADLRGQLLQHIQGDEAVSPKVQVTDFRQQAQAFVRLMDQVLEDFERAA